MGMFRLCFGAIQLFYLCILLYAVGSSFVFIKFSLFEFLYSVFVGSICVPPYISIFVLSVILKVNRL
jgi:hypothetical protein